jgi:Tfp pilus assembly protein PilV
MSQLTKKESSTISLKKGFVLVEVILASSLFIIFLTAFAGAFLYGQEATVQAGNKTEALMLAESGMEAVRNIRNEDFGNLLGGKHGLLFSSGKWSFQDTQDTTGIYTRVIDISTSTKDRAAATTTVTWQQSSYKVGSISLFRTFSNWLDLRYWYYPGLVSQLTITDGGDKIQVVDNYAYVTGYATPHFYIVNVTSSTSPQITGTITLTGNLQNLYVSGNYAYVVTDDNSKELQIINISNKTSPTLAATYNAAGSAAGMGIYIVGTKAYMTRQNSGQDEFLVLDVSTPSSPTLLGSMNVGATAYEPIISGNYAYIATDNNTQELQIVDISNSNSPTLTGSLNLSLKEQNRSSAITKYGNLIYLGQGKDLYILDVTNPTSPVQKSDTSVADYFNDVSINLGRNGRYIFVATSDVNKEFKVYDVSSSTAPYLFGTSLDLTGSNESYGIAYSTSTNIVYVVSHATTNSFFIIAP